MEGAERKALRIYSAHAQTGRNTDAAVTPLNSTEKNKIKIARNNKPGTEGPCHLPWMLRFTTPRSADRPQKPCVAAAHHGTIKRPLFSNICVCVFRLFFFATWWWCDQRKAAGGTDIQNSDRARADESRSPGSAPEPRSALFSFYIAGFRPPTRGGAAVTRCLLRTTSLVVGPAQSEKADA